MKGRGRNGRAPIIWSAGRAPASSGPAGKGWLAYVSPLAAGFVLFLAFQAFIAVIL